MIAEMLARRGFANPEQALAFLDPVRYAPAPAGDLLDLQLAADRLAKAVRFQEPIVVWGDFDADGQTATALLLEVLRGLGARVTFHIPMRGQGHGMHQHDLERIIHGGGRLILTCDTGVAAHAEIAHANSLGADVIVTDHHVPTTQLPEAFAVVNTHRLPLNHPKASLAGVGVAYELATALAPEAAAGALDLVALGTVADVANLRGDTRYHVQRGIAALRSTRRFGLHAIYEAAKLRAEDLNEEHIGFVLAPRLNAVGRLDDAALAVELLTTGDRARAQDLAGHMEALNTRRKLLTRQVTDAAWSQIEGNPALLEEHHALVLEHPTWPSGIVGIVAGRLAERVGKPTVLIATPPASLARGSGRSISGVNLVAAMDCCRHLLERYGGHAGAGGFAVQAERIPELRHALSRAIANQVGELPEPTLSIDAYLTLQDLKLDLARQISRMGPFGEGNPPVVVAVRDLAVTREEIIGRTKEHRRIVVKAPSGHEQTVVWWRGAGQSIPQGHFDLALKLTQTDYRGTHEAQIEWIDARRPKTENVSTKTGPEIQVWDYRQVSVPGAMLEKLLGEGDIQVWSEVLRPSSLLVRNRIQLEGARRLAIWTIPPARQVISEALERVKPVEIYLFSRDPGLDGAPAFMARLAGLINYTMKERDGTLHLGTAAASSAHRVKTVKAGIDLLMALGQLRYHKVDRHTLQLSDKVGEGDPGAVTVARVRLKALLRETAAYRAYFRSAPVRSLASGWHLVQPGR